MLTSFKRRLSRRIGGVLKFLAPEDVDDSLLDREKNFYKRDIIRAARSIEMYENELISPTVLAKSINRIGCLAYTGGPPANKCAGTYIPKFAELLRRANTKTEVKTAILKSLSTIAIHHVDHQNLCFQEGLLETVSNIIINSTEALQMWAVYCMYCLVLDNIRSLQVLKENTKVHESLRQAQSIRFYGFECNYADTVLKLTGLEPVKVAVKDPDLLQNKLDGKTGENKNRLSVIKEA